MSDLKLRQASEYILTRYACDYCRRSIAEFILKGRAPLDRGRCGATNVPQGLLNCAGILRLTDNAGKTRPPTHAGALPPGD